jgi:hypothetical protein
MGKRKADEINDTTSPKENADASRRSSLASGTNGKVTVSAHTLQAFHPPTVFSS